MFVVHVIVALFVVIFAAAIFEITGGEALAQFVPLGVTVYTVDPVLWDKVAVSTPPLQDMAKLPPPLDVATDRSYEGESMMKVPPVVCERVTNTLVALTWRASATEPVAIVSVVAEDDKVTDSAVGKLSGAAWAVAIDKRHQAPLKAMRNELWLLRRAIKARSVSKCLSYNHSV